jgi:hypothetical protein
VAVNVSADVLKGVLIWRCLVYASIEVYPVEHIPDPSALTLDRSEVPQGCPIASESVDLEFVGWVVHFQPVVLLLDLGHVFLALPPGSVASYHAFFLRSPSLTFYPMCSGCRLSLADLHAQ